MSPLQRTGRNRGGYCGETIDIDQVLSEISTVAQRHGWRSEVFHPDEEQQLIGARRGTEQGRRRLYLSTGIHGDEPAGPLAVRQLIADNPWPEAVEVWLCPCLNPGGFRRNRRENPAGLDLNRQYLHLRAAETRSHIDWLHRQPSFDVTLCLHEDWESHGFYLYELNPDQLPSFAEAVVRDVSAVCPIDLSSEIEGRPATGGIIRPSTDPRSRPDWPEAFWLLTHKTRLSYTFEAPSDFALPLRIAALVAGVKAVLREMERA